VGVCTLGLTLVALAMMEIWGKFPPRDLVEMSMGGMVYNVKERLYAHVTLIEVKYDPHTGV
jgi:hypothetical protein